LSKRKCQQNFDFTLNGENLDVIDSYIYLGITFKYNGSFVDARKRLVEHAQRSSIKVTTELVLTLNKFHPEGDHSLSNLKFSYKILDVFFHDL
jgi:hypothetical protein